MFSFKYGQEDFFTRTANQEYRSLIAMVLNSGHIAAPRGMKIKECLNAHTLVSLSHPRVEIPARKLGQRFRYAEAWWILTGRNDVASIEPYSKTISQFSDDGVYFQGAYGPKVVDQLPYVVQCLREDNDSRQAIISIWRENLRKTKDVPCTLNMQFLIREDALHCIVNMRSSDLWLGWPYDVFNFSMITRRVYELLHQTDPIEFELAPGILCINHGSLHLYEENWKAAEALIKAGESSDGFFEWYQKRGTLVNLLEAIKDAPLS